jgi:hypothetical protein
MKLTARTLVLHPYYKLAYIKLAWGGKDEQKAEIAAGNKDAINWQDEARKLVEREVSIFLNFRIIGIDSTVDLLQMEKYWKNRPQSPPAVWPTDVTSGDAGSASVLSDYDRYRLTLLSGSMECDGWEAELRRYLKDMPADVSSDTDIVEWWQVCPYIFLHNVLSLKSMLESLQCVPYPCTHCTGYPPYPGLFNTL